MPTSGTPTSQRDRHQEAGLARSFGPNALRALRVLAPYALALGFLGIVLWRTRVWNIGDSLGRVDPLTLLLVPLFSLLLSLPLAVRQRIILEALDQRVPAWRLLPISYYGNTVGFLTPASSGEALRPALFQRALDMPLPQGVAVVLFERILSTSQLAITGLLALLWTGILPWPLSAALMLPLLGASFLPLLAYWAIARFGARFRLARLRRLLPHRFRDRLEKALADSEAALRRLFLSPRLLVSFCLMTYLTFLIMALQFWILVRDISPHVSLSEAWVVLVASNVAGILSGLPLGLGATDAVMVSLLGVYGVAASASVAVVVLLRGLINLPTGILGLLAYLTALRQRPAPALRPVPAASRE